MVLELLRSLSAIATALKVGSPLRHIDGPKRA